MLFLQFAAPSVSLAGDKFQGTDGLGTQDRTETKADSGQISDCELALRNPWRSMALDGINYELDRRTDPVDEERYFVLRSRGTGTESPVSEREVPSDARTKSILATSAKGELALNLLVQHFVKQNKYKPENAQGAYVFIDVNDLEKVNYFPRGTLDGHKYLERVGVAVRKSLREMDVSFRIGGDELAIVLGDIDPEDVVLIMARIQENLEGDQEAQNIFLVNLEKRWAELKDHLKNYGRKGKQTILSLLKDENFKLKFDLVNALPDEIYSKVQGRNIRPRSDESLLSLILNLYMAKRLSPTLSMGSTSIGALDTVESVHMRAEAQASRNKVEYKISKGLDVSKYSDFVSSYSPDDLQALRDLDLQAPMIVNPVPGPQ